jgi:Flp pilus assembly protein TadD
MKMTKNSTSMASGLALGLACFAMTSAAQAEPQQPDRSNLAFASIMNGNLAAAVTALEQQVRAQGDDPAAMINLGHVYAKLGRTKDAEAQYRSAIKCRNHYDLQLADGSVIYSRTAARQALSKLYARAD